MANNLGRSPHKTYSPFPSAARQKMVTQQAINILTIQEQVSADRIFTPNTLMVFVTTHSPTKFEHYANPMVHPTTGETISSYKRLINDPETTETWHTAFGKDFGGISQGDNKTVQKGTNAIFVMTHDEIAQVVRAGKNSHMQIPSWIIDRKKRTQTGSA